MNHRDRPTIGFKINKSKFVFFKKNMKMKITGISGSRIAYHQVGYPSWITGYLHPRYHKQKTKQHKKHENENKRYLGIQNSLPPSRLPILDYRLPTPKIPQRNKTKKIAKGMLLPFVLAAYLLHPSY